MLPLLFRLPSLASCAPQVNRGFDAVHRLDFKSGIRQRHLPKTKRGDADRSFAKAIALLLSQARVLAKHRCRLHLTIRDRNSHPRGMT